MAIPLPEKISRLIDGRNFAHLATIMEDGSPHSAPVWMTRQGDQVIVCTSESSVKGKNTRRDPRVAISIVDVDDPYSEAQLRGRVTERRNDSDFKYIDAASHKYVGQAWPYRQHVPVALVIEIDQAHYSKQPFEHSSSAAVKRPA